MLRRLFLLVLCAGIVPQALGRSSGALGSACGSMTPGHTNTQAQTSTAPVTLTVTNTDDSAVTEYSGGETLKGKLFHLLCRTEYLLECSFRDLVQLQCPGHNDRSPQNDIIS